MAKKKSAVKKKSNARKRKVGSVAKKVRKAPAKKGGTRAKKKTAVKKKSVARKTAAPKKSNPKRSAPKGSSSAKKTAVKKTAVKRTAAERKTSANRAKNLVDKARLLGRPDLPADAKLDFVFQKDYQAREIFAFLGVQTLRELEEYEPKDIVRKLTAPLAQTVDRIRKVLALSNRCLAKDRDYALKYKKKIQR